jgi:GIY-YIG catalytic domain
MLYVVPRNSSAAGTPWTNEEETTLLKSINEGTSIDNIANKHRRTPGGIRCRLALIASRMISADGRSEDEMCKMFNITPNDIRRVSSQKTVPEANNVPPTMLPEREKIIYVLKCTNNKYYVGTCFKDRIQTRYNQHLNGNGAAWTKLYPPIEIHLTKTLTDPLDEDHEVLKQMRIHTIDNVRGGSYSMCVLPAECIAVLQRQLNHAAGNCLVCGMSGHWARDCSSSVVVEVLPEGGERLLDGPKNYITRQCAIFMLVFTIIVIYIGIIGVSLILPEGEHNV